jgi:hypothetical protein
MIPTDATHHAEFYGQVDYYRLTHGLHYNTVIDHPVECWQKTDIWHVWENGQWVSPGSGWSSRRLQLLQHATS